MRYDADHKAKTRALVLAEAAKAIRKDGPHQVSLAGVMKRAGLTHGGFYAHFRSRDALLVAAIQQMFDSGRDRWIRNTLDRSPAGGLNAYINWYLSKPHRDNREAGCALAALASDLPRLSAPCRNAYAEGTRRQIALVAAHLAALRRSDPDALAASVWAELVGGLSLARIEIAPRRSDAILAACRRSLVRRLGISRAS